MNHLKRNSLSRFFALFIALTLAAPGSAFALREIQPKNSGLEEELTRALQEPDPLQAVVTAVASSVSRALQPSVPLPTSSAAAQSGLEEWLIAYPGGEWTAEQVQVLQRWVRERRSASVKLIPRAIGDYGRFLQIPEDGVYRGVVLDALSIAVTDKAGEAAEGNETEVYLRGGENTGFELNQVLNIPLQRVEWISLAGPLETERAKELAREQVELRASQDLAQFLSALRAATQVQVIKSTGIVGGNRYEVPQIQGGKPYAVYPQPSGELIIVNIPSSLLKNPSHWLIK